MASAGQIRLGGGGLRRLTAREAWLAAGLGLLAIGACAFYAQSWAQNQRDRFATAQADLAAARASRAAALRHGAAVAPELAQQGQIDAWSTHGRTFWLARLAIEERLEAAAAAAHLPSPEIRLSQAPEGGDVMLVKAEVIGPYVQGPWLAFMRALAASGPAFVVDKLDVSEADTAEYSISLLFPVKLDGPAPSPVEPAP